MKNAKLKNMKSKKYLLWFSTLIISFFLSVNLYARMREERNLSNLLKSRPTLKIFLGNFQNQSEQAEADPAVFKTVMGNFLKGRKSAQFILVNKPEESQIAIEANVLGYRYLEDDPPLDFVMGGTTGLIADVLVKQNYVEINSEFFIRDSKGKILWKDSFKTSVTQSNMPPQDAPLRVFEEASKKFVFKCFGPPSAYRKR